MSDQKGKEPEQCSTIDNRSIGTSAAGENNTCRDDAAFECLWPALPWTSVTQAGYVVARCECRDASKTDTPISIGTE